MHPNLHRRLRWGCFFLLFALIANCSWRQTVKKPDAETDILQETARLEKTARDHPDPSVRAQSHLRLASLYVNSRNPHLNYTRSLQEFGNYLSLAPAKPLTEDSRNWLAALREMERLRNERAKMETRSKGFQNQIERLQVSLEKTQETNKNLQVSLEKAQESNKNLREEVANLKEMIEKLKNLDLQMEEKRNLMK